ncbi:uncharacterized protein LOC102808826 [Saccoglossus kowalevskii]|uniref:Uncharacterized protein LOC102808826 n=1 Tax=Saccoglossus kowalevskii TaxID=10224 RepID=A0ABM0MY29_SACKO|nr:PREDICTED: uncharacterized protein LOC102808826 [Saccoglossus kowalevskii]
MAVRDTLVHLLVKLGANDTVVDPPVSSDVGIDATDPDTTTNVISQITPRAIAGIILAIALIVIGFAVLVRALYQKVTANKYTREDIRYSEILITDDADDDDE